MSNTHVTVEEVRDALKRIPLELRVRVNENVAKDAFEKAFAMLQRDAERGIADKGVAIKCALNERCVGKNGTKERKQKEYSAYWRTFAALCNKRQKAMRSTQRKRGAA